MKTFGIALGGGGARGLAHPVLLEVFDELGIRPRMIAGASIGSVIGAIYATGIPARDVREAFEELFVPRSPKVHHWLKTQLNAYARFVSLDVTGKGLLRPHRFLRDLAGRIGVSTFEELITPLRVVAADYWTGEQVVFDSGDLITGVHASMAVPGVFEPVCLGERVLIDGGAVNPVPYDLLREHCDVVIAVDITGNRSADNGAVPHPHESLLGAIQIMQASLIQTKLRHQPPDIYLRPGIEDVGFLEFDKTAQVVADTAAAKDQLKRELEHHLDD